jgi:hypothetical protein
LKWHHGCRNLRIAIRRSWREGSVLEAPIRRLTSFSDNKSRNVARTKITMSFYKNQSADETKFLKEFRHFLLFRANSELPTR